MSNQIGVLYIVATPIGNLGDLTQRAGDVLRSVDCVAAEDTRRTGQLLQHLNLRKQLISLHEHNEDQRVQGLIKRLQEGSDVALVSDAGTPLISDPGFRLVRAAISAGIDVTPIPGPCAAIAGLSVAGLPTDSFLFAGFLPPKTGSKQTRLRDLQSLGATLVFYVSVHDLVADLEAMVYVWGGQRRACLARELTKRYETLYHGTLSDLLQAAMDNADMHKGELVLMVEGAEKVSEDQSVTIRLESLLDVLLERLSVKDAVEVAVQLSGQRRNRVYRMAQERKPQGH